VPNFYIVFFAFDRSEITPGAAQVLDRAIADFRSTGSTGIRIEGHADRSGTDTYNLALSQRRAAAVVAYLRGKGVDQTAISTEAFGESRPRVPTADGVRNDENRRAEIYLRR
jgi:outer membrane protein OmpA-like peptidoglycan-associated protein